MSDLLDRAIARALPPDAPDETARMPLLFADEEEPAIELTPEEEVDLSEAETDQEPSATDKEAQAIFAKFRG